MADETPVRAPEGGAPPQSGPGGPPRQGGRPGGGPGGRGKFFRRKKVCKFCTEKIDAIPYRDVRLLQGFVAERGKIVPRRLTGVCTKHQRRLTRAIKQARNIALLPFATQHWLGAAALYQAQFAQNRRQFSERRCRILRGATTGRSNRLRDRGRSRRCW
jgi:small subunit ribosomal protein S18